jgi:hypothetical protein
MNDIYAGEFSKMCFCHYNVTTGTCMSTGTSTGGRKFHIVVSTAYWLLVPVPYDYSSNTVLVRYTGTRRVTCTGTSYQYGYSGLKSPVQYLYWVPVQYYRQFVELCTSTIPVFSSCMTIIAPYLQVL